MYCFCTESLFSTLFSNFSITLFLVCFPARHVKDLEEGHSHLFAVNITVSVISTTSWTPDGFFTHLLDSVRFTV